MAGRTDFDKRIALMSFDNAIELCIVTYLSLNPIQRAGRKFETADVERWSKNFHTKIEFLEHYVVSLLAAPMRVGRAEIIYFHGLRNDLYHGGNGFVPAEEHLEGIREASLWVFSTLFGYSAEDFLLPERKTSGPVVMLPLPGLSPTTAFLQAYIALKKNLDRVHADAGSSYIPQFHTQKIRLRETAEIYSVGLLDQYDPLVKEAKTVSDAIVDGKSSQKSVASLKSLTNRLNDVSELVDSRLRNYQLVIVEAAIRATANAALPNGDRKAGVVWQVTGSGLVSSLVSYVVRARLLPAMRDRHVVLLADRTEIALQIHDQIRHLTLDDKSIPSVLSKTNSGLIAALQEKRPQIVVAASRAIDRKAVMTEKECLVVGHNLNERCEYLPNAFPNSTRILFTNTPPEQPSKTLRVFGRVIGKYDLSQAFSDRMVVHTLIEHRGLGEEGNQSPKPDRHMGANTQPLPKLGARVMTEESLRWIGGDIVRHFQLRQTSWVGKGIVVVPSISAGEALYRAMTAAWQSEYGVTESGDTIRMLSSSGSSVETTNALKRFKDQNDPLALLIIVRGAVSGNDSPLVHTIYVLSELSKRARYQLVGRVSRSAGGKLNGLIVDYAGQDWRLE